MEDQSGSLPNTRVKSITEFVRENSREPATREPEEEEEKQPLVPIRKVSTNAVGRVYRERQRVRSRLSQRRKGTMDEDDDEDDTEDEQLVGRQGGDSITANHHYTFNMPGMPANRSEVPYMLLGCVVCKQSLPDY